MKGKDKYSVKNCRTSKQFAKAVRKQGGWVSTGGKHPHLHHPNGGSEPLTTHTGDMATGSKFALIAKLIKLGFAGAACFVPIFLLIWLINGLISMY